MKINFENLSEQNYHLLIISPDNKKVNSNNHLDNSSEDILNGYLEKKNKEKEIIETFLYKNIQNQQKKPDFVSKFTYGYSNHSFTFTIILFIRIG